MVAFMHTGTRLTAGYRYTTLGDATVKGLCAQIAAENTETTSQQKTMGLCMRTIAGTMVT